MIKFKTKEQLDIMSEEEVQEFRRDFLRNGNYSNSPDQIKYVNEIEFYQSIRFKESYYDMHKRWRSKFRKDPELNKDLSLIVNITRKKGGTDMLYFLHIKTQLDKIIEFKYIKGIKIPKECKNFSKIWK